MARDLDEQALLCDFEKKERPGRRNYLVNNLKGQRMEAKATPSQSTRTRGHQSHSWLPMSLHVTVMRPSESQSEHIYIYINICIYVPQCADPLPQYINTSPRECACTLLMPHRSTTPFA